MSAREGIIVKKCSTEWHKPATNAACRAGTCQHTCPREKIERCPHAWTLRYSVNGRQREQSFRDDTDPATGRVKHGTGKSKAKDAQLKLTHDKRALGQVFADPKAGSVNFGQAAEAHLARLAVNDRTRETYLGNYRTRVRPALGSLTVAQVAVARDTVADLLAVSMREAGIGTRRITRMIILGTLDEAVAAGKIPGHRLAGIELFDDGPAARKDFVFPAHAQVAAVAGGTEDGKGREPRGAGVSVSARLAPSDPSLRVTEAESFALIADKPVPLVAGGDWNTVPLYAPDPDAEGMHPDKARRKTGARAAQALAGHMTDVGGHAGDGTPAVGHRRPGQPAYRCDRIYTTLPASSVTGYHVIREDSPGSDRRPVLATFTI